MAASLRLRSPATPALSPRVVTKVGGQALADGVFMRTDRAWAIARADGSIETGTLARTRVGRVPVLRVVVGLGGALALGLRALAGGSPSRRRSRTARNRRLLVLLLALGVGGFLLPSWP